jgi:FkbM family methyltransferase
VAYDALNLVAQRLLGTRIKTGPARGLVFRGGDTAGYILGFSEPAVQRTLVAHLRPGDVYFDVGTHVGFLALLGSRLVGVRGAVHCFEPVPENVAALQRNLMLNATSNTAVHQVALGDRDGTASMDPTSRNITANFRDDGQVEVEVARLDSMTQLPSPHVVKVDVEGAETQVLNGARGMLARCRPLLVIEIHGEQEQPVRAILDELGYPEPVMIRDGGMPHLVAAPAGRDSRAG